MRRLRSLVTGCLLSLTSLVLTLGFFEVLARVGLIRDSEMVSTAIKEKHSSRPGQPDFRLPVGNLEDKGDVFRILVIGDSFAWGDGVYAEDAFPHRLETRLNAVSRRERFEVVNWSRPGWNTVRQVTSLRGNLGWLQPDAMVLTFVLNDPEPTARPQREALSKQAFSRGSWKTPNPWLLAHSRLYAYIWTRVANTRSHRNLRGYYRSLFAGEHWQECVDALQELRRMSRNQKVPLLLVILPIFDGPMDDSYHYADLHARVSQVAADLKLAAYDLLQVFRGVDGVRLPVVPYNDAHPNELAHRIAADGILDELTRRRMIPRLDRRVARKRQDPGEHSVETGLNPAASEPRR